MSARIAFLCAGLAALLALLPGASTAQASGAVVEQVRVFAGCAGRMLALRDHLALFSDPGTDRAEAARTAHLAILDALVETLREDEFDTRRIYHWRIDARAAQSAVLSQAAFGTAPETRRLARAASNRQIASCNRLILGA